MIQSRLDELMEKAKDSQINLNEVAEICGAVLESVSRHSKDIKSKIKNIEDKLAYIEERLDDIQNNISPAFGIIMEDEED